MFNYGMKVTIYSENKAECENVGWHRGGTDISYFRNNIRKDFNVVRYFFTLSFTHTFEYDDDTVFFSYSYPYTLSNLRSDLRLIENDPERMKFCSFSSLCKTLSGVDVPILTVTTRNRNSSN